MFSILSLQQLDTRMLYYLSSDWFWKCLRIQDFHFLSKFSWISDQPSFKCMTNVPIGKTKQNQNHKNRKKKNGKQGNKTVEPEMKMICNKNIWKCYFNSGRRSRDLNAIFIQNTLNLITTKTSSKWHLIEFLYDRPGKKMLAKTELDRITKAFKKETRREMKDEDRSVIEMSIKLHVGRNLLFWSKNKLQILGGVLFYFL